MIGDERKLIRQRLVTMESLVSGTAAVTIPCRPIARRRVCAQTC